MNAIRWDSSTHPHTLSDCRLPFGGLQASQYLVKLLQLKYPNFPAANLLALPQNGTVS